MRRVNLFSIIIFLLFCSGTKAVGQVFQSFTYDELARPIQQAARAHNQMADALTSLIRYVYDVLEHDIDSQLRKEMNSEIKSIETLYNQLAYYGYSAAIVNNYNATYKRIQQEITSYNNRVAQAREQASRAAAEQREREAKLAAEPDNWTGTGFALNDGYIVTNYHVVDRATTISVHGINGDLSVGYTARVIGVDRVNDLAIIKITDSRFSSFGQIPYSIKSQMADVGEDVWVLGYPMTQILGNEIKLTTGVVSSRSGYQGDVSTYQISAPVQPGNSGGPLFDSSGNIVGIVNAGVPDAENVGYAIKIAYLQNLVDSYSLSSSIPKKNAIASLALKEQVKRVKDFVFFLVCSTKVNNHQNVASPSSPHRENISEPQAVDLGLSIKWADRNVGASSPSDYGSFFAWGETSPKSDYGKSTLKYCLDYESHLYNKYNTKSNYGTIDNKSHLDLSDDAARANWGGKWRMPTNEEQNELREKCTWTWTSQGGRNGYKVTSKANGNSIFLPAAGFREKTSLYGVGSLGEYWSSSLDVDYPNRAYYIEFDEKDYRNTPPYYSNPRYIGLLVRPVSE